MLPQNNHPDQKKTHRHGERGKRRVQRVQGKDLLLLLLLLVVGGGGDGLLQVRGQQAEALRHERGAEGHAGALRAGGNLCVV